MMRKASRPTLGVSDLDVVGTMLEINEAINQVSNDIAAKGDAKTPLDKLQLKYITTIQQILNVLKHQPGNITNDKLLVLTYMMLRKYQYELIQHRKENKRVSPRAFFLRVLPEVKLLDAIENVLENILYDNKPFFNNIINEIPGQFPFYKILKQYISDELKYRNIVPELQMIPYHGNFNKDLIDLSRSYLEQHYLEKRDKSDLKTLITLELTTLTNLNPNIVESTGDIIENEFELLNIEPDDPATTSASRSSPETVEKRDDDEDPDRRIGAGQKK